MKFYLLTLFLFLFSCFIYGQPSFDIKPVTKQLYARNVSTNFANVHFQGVVFGSGNYVIKRFIYVNGSDLTGEGAHDVDLLLPKTGPFSFDDFIPAALVNYRYHVYQVLSPANHVPVGGDIAREVVAGDAYIVYGQSNAEAGSFSGNPNDLYQSNFIRTVGTRRELSPYDFSTWRMAEGRQYSDKTDTGSIGNWPLYVGKQIVDNFQVPVAIFSYPKSGAQIPELLRNDIDKTDINTPYGRLLRKVNSSGLKNNIRGIFYFQGEGDASADASTAFYKTKFKELYNDWKSDFIGFTRVLTFQIRPGGGISQAKALKIEQAQKELAEEMEDVELISTNHIDHFTDNTHYGFEGYMECGKRAYNLVKNFFYGVALQPDEVSPVIKAAGKGQGNTVLALLSPVNATYTVDTDFKSLVLLEGTGTYSVTHVEVKGEILEITYTKSGSDPTGLTILAKEGPASPFLYNKNGIGIFSMQGLPIEAALPLYFNYFRLGGSSAQLELSWEISDNNQFQSFEVQESKEGSTWVPLAILPAKFGRVEKYNWMIPGNTGHKEYYRILAERKNGSSIYSNILSVNTSSKTRDWNVYPNPIDANSVIAFWSDENAQISWYLLSMDGKYLSSNISSVSKGINTIPLSLPSGLHRGLYVIRMETAQGISFRRMIY
jgi:Carbohydrate esterase, sialic acid-specific acetylesterase